MGDSRHPIIYRWDLDKTYLRTNFDSLRQLVRTAFEPARAKRTVPGASVLMREISATNPAAIAILSGSPEQMRRRLEAKLRIDGVRWDSFTLKPSLRNLMRGRFRFVKDQVLYKLGSLLSARANEEPGTDEILFGDDAEADAFIYSLYADICAGTVRNEELMPVLHEAKVYEEEIPVLVRLAARVPQRNAVQRIFIHLERMRDPGGFEVLGKRVCPFYNYFQPALVLMGDGYLSPDAVMRVGAEIVTEHDFTPEALLASFIDLGERGYIGRGAYDALVGVLPDAVAQTSMPGRTVMLEFLQALRENGGTWLQAHAPATALHIDYVGLFAKEKARAHEAKQRATWRRGD